MKKKIYGFILSIILIFAINNYSNAASASIQCSSTGNVNSPMAISVTGSGAQWNLILKVNGQTIASNSEMESVTTKSITFSGTYTPTATGNITATLEGSVTDESGTIRSFGSKTISIGSASNSSGTTNNNNNNQPSTNTKSNVATLSNLGIRPNDFSGFKANTTSYNVEVPYSTEKIEVYASKGQSGQTISGTGVRQLKEGANTFEVVVTAEDGTTKKTYTINVTRKSKDDTENTIEEETTDEEENTEEEEMPLFGLSELEIIGLKLSPEFKADIYEYKVELKEDIDKLDIRTLSISENSTIEIIGNENLQEGENVITILIKGENEEDTVAYQIIVNKILEEEEEEIQNDNRKIIIIAVAGGVVFLIILIAIIISIKKKRENSGGYIPYENIIDNYDEEINEVDEVEKNDDNNYIESIAKTKDIDINLDDFEDEKPKRKRRPKGKRFK